MWRSSSPSSRTRTRTRTRNPSTCTCTCTSSSGVILIITLIALVLLAGLVLWVMNLGQQVNNRFGAQNSADAAATAGATWLARSMNTVAANNTDMARYLALVNVLDAMPQSVDFTLRETTAWRDQLTFQLSSGGVGGDPARLAEIVNDLLEEMRDEMTVQIDNLTTTDAFFRRTDVGQMTQYNRDGYLWQSMYAMDELNGAITDNLTLMTQRAGIQSGESNLPAEEQSAVVLLPLEQQLPYRRTSFADFERPVRMGLLPEEEDDKLTGRGPWDVVFGWRDILGYYVGGTYVPGSSQSTGSASGKDVGISRGPIDTGNVVGAEWVPVAYRTFGPYEWLLRQVHQYTVRDLYYTRFDWYERRIANRKLQYIYPDPLPVEYTNNNGLSVRTPYLSSNNGSLVNSGIREVLDPDWRTTFEEAVEIARRGSPEIRETAYIVVELKSKYPPSDGRFLTPGTWKLVDERNLVSPRIVVQRGWEDARQWGVEQTNQWVWRDDWEYQVYFDQSIGITPIYQNVPAPGTGSGGGSGGTTQAMVPQPVYRTDYFVFIGVNVGEETGVTNPYEGFNPGSSDAPAPTTLRTDVLDVNDDAARFDHLTFLSIVRRPDTPQAWPSRFRGGRPSPNMVAIAQAKVFNNHSWDLWTQMWQSEMEPVSGYDDWLDAMQEGAPPPAPGVAAAELQLLHQYLTAGRGLAGVMLNH